MPPNTLKIHTFLSRLCGGESNQSHLLTLERFLSRLCGGESSYQPNR